MMADAPFMTAKEKTAVVKRWTTFLKYGCQLTHFTKGLYHHLTLHCSFIAHYNLHGFYETYFTEPESTEKFLAQFDRMKGCSSVEYGGTSWLTYPDYADVNNAMVDAAQPFLESLYTRCANFERDRDLSLADALYEKHGVHARAPKGV